MYYALRYLKAYFAADTVALREEATESARSWMVARGHGSLTWTDDYQSQASAYARSYTAARLHSIATSQAGHSHG